jgi:hypothetical protein
MIFSSEFAFAAAVQIVTKEEGKVKRPKCGSATLNMETSTFHICL